jgi:hypothetical protein
MQQNIIRNLASGFELYLTLHRIHATKTYDYAARESFNLSVIEHTRHRPKCKTGESWVYVAVPAMASLANLAPDQNLYIGAQTADRMFRGDNLGGENFHHAEMRRGRGDDNLESYLKRVGQVEVHRIAATDIYRLSTSKQELALLQRLMKQPLAPRTHQAGWLEQFVLHYELPMWRWNKDGANAYASRFLAEATAHQIQS